MQHSIKHIHIKSVLCFLSNHKVKSYTTKIKDDNMFECLTYQFYILLFFGSKAVIFRQIDGFTLKIIILYNFCNR